jgi:SAM-dependent methyltransferase
VGEGRERVTHRSCSPRAAQARRESPAVDVDRAPETALNRICAYFTMFPLRFPHRILRARSAAGQRVLDPFCGRGTTNYAARLAGLYSVGIDASPVAVAIARAKVAAATPQSVMRAYDEVLQSIAHAESPEGEFWRWAYAPRTLATISRLREGLLLDCHSPDRVGLRAVLLGALHGPVAKRPSHLSNQAPRTFAPKPKYSVTFWKAKGLKAAEHDVRALIATRAERYFGHEAAAARGRIVLGDSRTAPLGRYGKFDWIITSPPYYGMRTYVPDQWIRNWFVGGPPRTEYSAEGQLAHGSPEAFAGDLGSVWRRTARIANPGARLVVRFGGINDRDADPLAIIKSSLVESGWRILTINPAGSASSGRRQSLAFAAEQHEPRSEYDVWAIRS